MRGEGEDNICKCDVGWYRRAILRLNTWCAPLYVWCFNSHTNPQNTLLSHTPGKFICFMGGSVHTLANAQSTHIQYSWNPRILRVVERRVRWLQEVFEGSTQEVHTDSSVARLPSTPVDVVLCTSCVLLFCRFWNIWYREVLYDFYIKFKWRKYKSQTMCVCSA